MPLFLRERDVAELLTMEDAIAAVEDAFRLHGLGEVDNRPRQRPRLARSLIQVMPAAVPGAGFGLKAYTIGSGGVRFVVLLWDGETGDLQAVIEADKLGQIRTGAASGVATRHLARGNASTLGLFGTGWQALTQLEAVCAVRPIKHVWVYSRTAEHRDAFAREMSDEYGIDVEAVDQPRAAVVEADVVTTITTAREPLFDGRWLRPGTHINAAGSNRANVREIDVETVQRAHVVAIDDRAQGRVEAGELIAAVEAGVIAWDDVLELGQVVAGAVAGRKRVPEHDDNAITLFESLGVALEDVAVARRVYERALETGAGEQMPETILG